MIEKGFEGLGVRDHFVNAHLGCPGVRLLACAAGQPSAIHEDHVLLSVHLVDRAQAG